MLHIVNTQWILKQSTIHKVVASNICWHGVWRGRSRSREMLTPPLRATLSLSVVTSTLCSSPLTRRLLSAPLWTERNKTQGVDLDLDVRQISDSMWPEICHWKQNFVARFRAISLKLKVIDLHGLGTRSLGWDPDLASLITHLIPFQAFLLSHVWYLFLGTQDVILKAKIFMESSSGH